VVVEKQEEEEEEWRGCCWWIKMHERRGLGRKGIGGREVNAGRTGVRAL